MFGKIVSHKDIIFPTQQYTDNSAPSLRVSSHLASSADIMVAKVVPLYNEGLMGEFKVLKRSYPAYNPLDPNREVNQGTWDTPNST